MKQQIEIHAEISSAVNQLEDTLRRKKNGGI